MENWNESYNWTYEQVMNVVAGKDQVTLDCEHASYENMLDICKWLEEKGYKTTIPDSRDYIKVERKN